MSKPLWCVASAASALIWVFLVGSAGSQSAYKYTSDVRAVHLHLPLEWSPGG